jgi:hypothetical protein
VLCMGGVSLSNEDFRRAHTHPHLTPHLIPTLLTHCLSQMPARARRNSVPIALTAGQPTVIDPRPRPRPRPPAQEIGNDIRAGVVAAGRVAALAASDRAEQHAALEG